MPGNTKLNKELADLISKSALKTEDQQQAINLIAQGADIKTQDPIIGDTLLISAIIRDELDFASKILALDSNNTAINITDRLADQGNNTPLILAIKKGYYDFAIELVERGADVDICCGRRGINALQLACFFVGYGGHSPEQNESIGRLIKKLITVSKQPYAKNEYGVSALDLLHTDFEEDDFGYYILVDIDDLQKQIRVPLKGIKPKQMMVEYDGKLYAAVYGDLSHDDSFNLATTLCSNCIWHRQDFRNHITKPRTHYLKSEAGRKTVADIDEAFAKVKQKTLSGLKTYINPESSLFAQVTAFEMSLNSLHPKVREEIIDSLSSLIKNLYADFVIMDTLSNQQIQRHIESRFATFSFACEGVIRKYKSSISQLVLGTLIAGAAFIATGFFTGLALSVGLSLLVSPPLAIFIGVIAGIVAGTIVGSLVTKTFYSAKLPALENFLNNTRGQDRRINQKSDYSIFNDFIRTTPKPMVEHSDQPSTIKNTNN